MRTKTVLHGWATHSFILINKQFHLEFLFFTFFCKQWYLSLFLHSVICFISSLCLLLWFLSLHRQIPPGQEVVGDQRCEEVCSHAGVPPQDQTQRLCQHEQAEHVLWRTVVQLHQIVLRGFHHPEKIHQCHPRVEGQFLHGAADRMLPRTRKPLGLTCANVLERSLWNLLKYWGRVFAETHSPGSDFLSLADRNPSEVWRWIWEENRLGPLIRRNNTPVKHYPPAALLIGTPCSCCLITQSKICLFFKALLKLHNETDPLD